MIVTSEKECKRCTKMFIDNAVKNSIITHIIN